MANNIYNFHGGSTGHWEVIKMQTVTGEPLQPVTHLRIHPASSDTTEEHVWTLTGLISNLRYTEKQEKESLVGIQEDLGRAHATCAALIPLRKSEAWWLLAQDERRNIFEKQSEHTQTGLKYLPAIARKLYHCRDIGGPFDFLTWFEYAPAHAHAFEELVARLRSTEEWSYVDREVDIRLSRVFL
ncbi:MAG: chlorite dismutase family protein [Sphingobacteriaceae bacterium]|nr:chlorite dismutase family protein [Sphingobacteriaceae bacterium]